MRISLIWLSDFIDIDLVSSDPEVVAGTLTLLGLAVDGLEESGRDWVFELDVPSNRPDCLSHLGVARELAAYYNLKLRKPDLTAPPEHLPASQYPATVRILDSELCPRYAARVLTQLQIGESPHWLKSRLESVGQRPINNVVDVTNYVLLELGHPLHAFDYEKLSGRQIVVRRAALGERLVTLDGNSHELSSDMLAICDAEEPVALAGIMGGAGSEISPGTATLLLESAYFQPASIRRTAQSLKMSTEASYRFERGADPEMPVRALNRTCRLLEEISGGLRAGPVIDVNPVPCRRTALSLSSQRILQVTGIEIAPEFVKQSLTGLEFEVSEGESPWSVNLPSFRSDIELEDDLVEEVLRHYGYDKIVSTYPPAGDAGLYLTSEARERTVCDTLGNWGFFEAVNLAFTTPSAEEVFWGPSVELVPILNPLTSEDSHLRASLIPGLVKTLRRNHNFGNVNVRLFEIGQVFSVADPPAEATMLGLIACGDFYAPYWKPDRDPVNYFHMKGVLDSLFARMNAEVVYERHQDRAFLHPGIAASILLLGERAGYLGRLHPGIEEHFKFRTPVFVAEVSLAPILTGPQQVPCFETLTRFPGVERDLSFVVDKRIEYATIRAAIKALNLADLGNIQLIDFYQGPKLPQEKVGVTVRLTFVSPERTLTQEEVNRYGDDVVAALTTNLDVELRR